jgi:hypothetical protein
MIFETFKRRISEFYQYWTTLSYIKYILFSIIVVLVATVPFVLLLEVMGISDEEVDGPQIHKLSLGGAFVAAIIFAPITETLIGQAIPIKLIQK